MNGTRAGEAPLQPPFRVGAFLRAFDLRVVLPALLLSATGISAIAATQPDLVASQVQGLVVGVLFAAAASIAPWKWSHRLVWPVWIAAILLLLVVLVPGVGHGAKGAHRWIRVGGVQFQPSEFAKAAHVLLLAHWIRFRKDHRTFRGLGVPFLLTLIPFLLIAREPDLGSALLFVPPLFTMLWAAGARTKHLLAVVALGVASLPVAYLCLHDYQLRRVHTFLPVLDRISPLPAAEGLDAEAVREMRRNADYHVNQAIAAVSGGGVTGQGWGEGPMNLANRVPEDWTDFVFVVHAEEWGFLGVLFLAGTWLVFLLALTLLASECRDPAARLLCVGSLTVLGVQASVNLMMTMGLAPVVGVPLPFGSYGRSAMLSAWILTGLALHAKAQGPPTFTSRDFER